MAPVKRFDCPQTSASREKKCISPGTSATGDVVLSKRPGAQVWNEFFALLHAIEVPADFMAERPMNKVPPERGIFDDEP